MARATDNAVLSFFAPVTRTRMTCPTPSALRMMSNASPERTSRSPWRSSSRGTAGRRPEDKMMAVSLVLWSLSTEMRFSDLSTHHASSSRSVSRGMAISVQTKQSRVAMFGSIIPAPFAVPRIVP